MTTEPESRPVPADGGSVAGSDGQADAYAYADAFVGPVAVVDGETGAALGCSAPPGALEPQPEPVRPGEPDFREPTDAERQAAEQLPPGSLLWAIDRHFAPVEGEPPPVWALAGHWFTGEDQEVAGWVPNADHRPSPDTLGWPAPADGVDAAVRTIATGYDEPELLPFALADAVVAVFIDPDGEPAPTEAPDGTPAVAVLPVPDAEQAPELPPFAVTGVPALLDHIPDGHDVLFLSSTAPVAQRVATDSLRSVLGVLEERPEHRAPGWDTPYPTGPRAVGGTADEALPPAPRPATATDGPSAPRVTVTVTDTDTDTDAPDTDETPDATAAEAR
ncbi:type VII secretion system-associated protein [Streptomyces sp. SM14]|uniref:type VII secretion system-associated protein n=1 Tax=Streptomyces sp. SM14 TaxID=1736045 RepID=UPI000CD4A45F|nr:type VII secretion system-associated protein [Streptomyces sp. SM14]